MARQPLQILDEVMLQVSRQSHREGPLVRVGELKKRSLRRSSQSG